MILKGKDAIEDAAALSKALAESDADLFNFERSAHWLKEDGAFVPLSYAALSEAIDKYVAIKRMTVRDGKPAVEFVPSPVSDQIKRAMLTGRDLYSAERNCSLVDRLPPA